jgi:class 3 adenylate cyclase
VASEQIERKLVAILAADVLGYSRLAGAGEEGIVARLRTLRSDPIDPTIAVTHGRRHSDRVPQSGGRGALRHRVAARHGRAQCRPSNDWRGAPFTRVAVSCALDRIAARGHASLQSKYFKRSDFLPF